MSPRAAYHAGDGTCFAFPRGAFGQEVFVCSRTDGSWSRCRPACSEISRVLHALLRELDARSIDSIIMDAAADSAGPIRGGADAASAAA